MPDRDADHVSRTSDIDPVRASVWARQAAIEVFRVGISLLGVWRWRRRRQA